jgi:hypothetical protein
MFLKRPMLQHGYRESERERESRSQEHERSLEAAFGPVTAISSSPQDLFGSIHHLDVQRGWVEYVAGSRDKVVEVWWRAAKKSIHGSLMNHVICAMLEGDFRVTARTKGSFEFARQGLDPLMAAG